VPGDWPLRAGQVQITGSGTFTMTRDGVPYYIKGIDGGANLNLAQQYGVNSLRTYNSNNAMGTLNNAATRCMTVLLGVELSQVAADYTNPTFLDAKRAEVTNLLATVKTHRALLMWALGNEIQLGAGVDNQTTWGFVQELATLIHQQDPNHPVIAALPKPDHVHQPRRQWAPAIDAIGLNNYATSSRPTPTSPAPTSPVRSS
jgi:endo-1,4-beta-mannosidase